MNEQLTNRDFVETINLIIYKIPETEKHLINQLVTISHSLRGIQYRWDILLNFLKGYFILPREDWHFEIFSIFFGKPVDEIKEHFKSPPTTVLPIHIHQN